MTTDRLQLEVETLILTTRLIREAKAKAIDPATGQLNGVVGAEVAALYRSRLVTIIYCLKHGANEESLRIICQG